MKINFSRDIRGLQSYLPDFLILVDRKRWQKRLQQLCRESSTSAVQAHIVLHYHWLELAIGHHLSKLTGEAPLLDEDMFSSELLAGLYFAQTVVEVNRLLGPKGQNALRGRLRDALKSDSGFAPLFSEMDIARRLFDAGFQVEFSDLEGLARHDLRFWSDRVAGEVECKSISADAGRQIHRRDFYRFMSVIEDQIAARAAIANEILLVTLHERLPPDHERRRELSQAALHMLDHADLPLIQGSFFSIERCDFEQALGKTSTENIDTFYRRCRNVFGESCHVSGAMTPDHTCLLVMRSMRADDHSKPIYEALKEADSQFTSSQPSFIVLQFDDIQSTDLLSRDLRKRIGILAYAFYYKRKPSHVSAIYYCAYNGFTLAPSGAGNPAVAVPNPQPKFSVSPGDYAPFLGSISDVEFASILGAAPPTENLSFIEFEAGNGGAESS